MSAVIQATCPGCKKVLRIPSDWIRQAIRCKHCGLVMAAKQPLAAVPVATMAPATVSGRATPLPYTHGKVPVATVAQAGAGQPVVAPLALPVASGSPFADLDAAPTPRAKSPRSQSKRGSGWWKGPVIVLGVLFLATVLLAVTFTVAWPFIGPRLLPSSSPVVQNGDSKDSDSSEPPKPEPIKKIEPKPDPKNNDPKKDKDTKPDPKKDKDTKPDPKKDKDPKVEPKPPVAGTLFPRRALVVSVHNYLYANPVGAGQALPGARNLNYLVTKLNTVLKIPNNQIAHLSDEAGKGKSRGPTKQVIEKTLDDFLGTSRDQDRILVFLIGHAVDIDGEGYFVPIEGELGNSMTLISLKWIFEELKNCKARQKILVLDVGRFSPTHGFERPGSFQTKDDLAGPMTAKFDAALKEPPDGVQVWTSCVAEQKSYETDESQVGVFIDKLIAVLEKGVQGTIQHPEDPIPVEKLNDAVAAAMKTDLTKFKLTQTPRLSGKEAPDGAPYNAKADPAKPPLLAASASNQENVKLIQAVLSDISTPPVKGGNLGDATIKFEMLPPFPLKALKDFGADETSPALEGPIQKARAMLWAISTATPPEALKNNVEEIRARSKVNLSYLKEGFKSPKDENVLKKEIANHERQIADLIDDVEQAYKKFAEIEIDRSKEPKRWLANYDYIKARMEEQIAYLYEYQSMLGQMRKEFPPLDKAQGNGWKLASVETLSGDSKGKKMAKSSAALLKKMADDYKGTPWEVLAKREKLTTLGLEWKTATVR